MKTDCLIITALESELKKSALPKGVEIVYSGIGKINATIATIQAITEFLPKKIINFGTVGRVNPSLSGLIEIGKVIQRDMSTEPLAPRGKTPFCIRPYEYQSTGEFICGTGDSFVTDQDPWLQENKVDVVDMELFAIAAAAHQFNVPWYSYKFITDDANADSGNHWQDRVQHGEQLFLEVLRKNLSY